MKERIVEFLVITFVILIIPVIGTPRSVAPLRSRQDQIVFLQLHILQQLILLLLDISLRCLGMYEYYDSKHDFTN